MLSKAYIIKSASVEELVIYINAVPEFSSLSQAVLKSRLDQSAICLVANSSDGTPAGFKIGYQESSDVFYSWIGGVSKGYRGQGLAQLLLETQERMVIEKGYKRIKVKSMNQYPNMLKLLIKNGYYITGYEDRGTPKNSKICFEKSFK